MRLSAVNMACLFSVCVFFLLTSTSLAQTINTGNVSITTNPNYPGPNEAVTAELDAYSYDLRSASVAWYLDGAEQTTCRDTRSCDFVTGGRGSVMNITALMTLANGQTKTVQHSIAPVRVDVVIEAETTTPLFYKGRALPSPGSTIRAVALPFSNTAASQLVYTWELDGTILFGGPLRGKNTAVFQTPFSGSSMISVAIATVDGTVLTKKTVEVRTVEPTVVFYEDNPLRGLSRVGLSDTYQLSGDEVTVRAEPYFMNIDLRPENTRTKWEINGSEVKNPSSDPQVITLRSGGGTGSFDVSFYTHSLDTLLQDVRDSFIIRF